MEKEKERDRVRDPTKSVVRCCHLEYNQVSIDTVNSIIDTSLVSTYCRLYEYLANGRKLGTGVE